MSDPSSSVRQITVRELKLMLEQGEPFELIDVRTDAEREIARIEGDRHLAPETLDQIDALERDRLLVFYCHHGMRSQMAARRFLSQGFTNVANVVGGIDAWSLEVDPSVRRY